MEKTQFSSELPVGLQYDHHRISLTCFQISNLIWHDTFKGLIMPDDWCRKEVGLKSDVLWNKLLHTELREEKHFVQSL